MRGLEEKNDTYEKIVGFGRGYVIVIMASGHKIKYYNGTLSWRNNNPGNLKYGPFAKARGALGSGSGGHAIFPTYWVGRAAMKDLLFGKDSNYINLTLEKAIARYAPSSDRKARNRPKTYARFLSRETGVPMNKVLADCTEEEKEKLLKKMIVYEGFKVGNMAFV